LTAGRLEEKKRTVIDYRVGRCRMRRKKIGFLPLSRFDRKRSKSIIVWVGGGGKKKKEFPFRPHCEAGKRRGKNALLNSHRGGRWTSVSPEKRKQKEKRWEKLVLCLILNGGRGFLNPPREGGKQALLVPSLPKGGGKRKEKGGKPA